MSTREDISAKQADTLEKFLNFLIFQQVTLYHLTGNLCPTTES